MFQPCPGLFERAFARCNVVAELVHFHDFLELDGPDGDELHVGIGRCLAARLLHFPGAAGGEDAIGEDEEIAPVHPEIAGNPGHDIFHAGNFRPVLKQDMARDRCYFQYFRKVVLLFHIAKIQLYSKKNIATPTMLTVTPMISFRRIFCLYRMA